MSNIHHDRRPGTMIDEDELEGGVTSAGWSLAKLCRLPPVLTHKHTRGKTNHIRSTKNVEHKCGPVPISLRFVSFRSPGLLSSISPTMRLKMLAIRLFYVKRLSQKSLRNRKSDHRHIHVLLTRPKIWAVVLVTCNVRRHDTSL